MKTHILIFCSILVLGLTVGNAQTAYREGHHERWNKRERIEHRRHGGTLSPRECHKLQGEGRNIHKAKRHMLRDGRLDPQERRKLHRMHHRHDRNIWREKHDRNRW